MLRISMLALIYLVLNSAFAQGGEPFFENSYAVVIGIDNYADPDRQKLSYAVKDARAFAEFLRGQGFQVHELYDLAATRENILSTLETWLVSLPSSADRVLVFFAGHGESRSGAVGERGYLVPIDGSKYASLISVVELQQLSAASAARHQLFVLDACFAGLAATRRGVEQVDRRTPNYVFRISERPARQLLAAGGANERVLDAGPNGHSYFMGYVLRALNEGLADKDGDGFLTATELFTHVRVAASSYTQTPIIAPLAGHEGGDFWFVTPNVATAAMRAKTALGADPYAPLNEGRVAFQAQDYAEARRHFQLAAKLGSADAMDYLGKLMWEGLGGPPDRPAALAWLKAAAELGHPGAMENLSTAYQHTGNEFNLDESRRWAAAFAEARKIDSRILPPESRILRPNPPTNLTVN